MMSLNAWPKKERPRERLLERGAAALSDTELLAVVLGTGCDGENVIETARRVIAVTRGIEGLASAGAGTLSRLRGIGTGKATRLLAAIELGVRIVEQRGKKPDSPAFACSRDIFEAYHARMGALRQEIFLAVGLNNRNMVIREVTVAMGSISECRVEPREVFRPLIAEAAARCLLLHNHPSGDPTPSAADISLTNRLVKVGELVGIPVLDHVVIGRFGHTSLRDLGLIQDLKSTA